MQLSVNLIGVLSQTLIKRKDGRGRIAAFESLVATPAVRNLIRENKSYQISSMIQTGARQKMHTLDQSLAGLVERSLVSYEDARLRAKDAGEFDRLITLGKQKEARDPGSTTNAEEGPGQATSQGVRGQPNRPAYRKE